MLSDRDGTKGKQFRRLTMASIQELMRQGGFCVRSEIFSGNRMSVKQPVSKVIWACPKYDGRKFDKDMLDVLPQTMMVGAMDTHALKTVGFVSAQGVIDHHRILEVSRQYTVLISSHDRIQEHTHRLHHPWRN